MKMNSNFLILNDNYLLSKLIKELTKDKKKFFGFVIIINKDKKFVGVLTASDILKLISNKKKQEIPIKDVMNKNPKFIKQENKKLDYNVINENISKLKRQII